MNECQRVFLVQARTCLVVFKLLLDEHDLPACHALHYLQMATELLGKAHAWKNGPCEKTHRAFVRFLRSLSLDRKAQKKLGYEGRNANWKNLIRKSAPFAEAIEDLAPALAGDGANPEYPWPPKNPQIAPAEHSFGIWEELMRTGEGRQFLNLTIRLFEIADTFL